MAKGKTVRRKSITPTVDERWAAESDAYTLAEAESIKMDRGRYSKAKKAAGRLAKEAEKKAKAIKKIIKQ